MQKNLGPTKTAALSTLAASPDTVSTSALRAVPGALLFGYCVRRVRRKDCCLCPATTLCAYTVQRVGTVVRGIVKHRLSATFETHLPRREGGSSLACKRGHVVLRGVQPCAGEYYCF